MNEDKNHILTQLLLSGEQSMVIEVSDDSAKSDGLHTAFASRLGIKPIKETYK